MVTSYFKQMGIMQGKMYRKLEHVEKKHEWEKCADIV